MLFLTTTAGGGDVIAAVFVGTRRVGATSCVDASLEDTSGPAFSTADWNAVCFLNVGAYAGTAAINASHDFFAALLHTI
jgi:hypothetical protein